MVKSIPLTCMPSFDDYLSRVATNVRYSDHSNDCPITTSEDSERQIDDKHTLDGICNIPSRLKFINFFTSTFCCACERAFRRCQTVLSSGDKYELIGRLMENLLDSITYVENCRPVDIPDRIQQMKYWPHSHHDFRFVHNHSDCRMDYLDFQMDLTRAFPWEHLVNGLRVSKS